MFWLLGGYRSGNRVKFGITIDYHLSFGYSFSPAYSEYKEVNAYTNELMIKVSLEDLSFHESNQDKRFSTATGIREVNNFTFRNEISSSRQTISVGYCR